MHCNNWIFDMDGTLTDSMTVVWEGAPDALLARYGRTPKSDLHKTLLTMGMADGAAYLIREYDLPLKMEDYNDVMWDVITKLYETVELKPGVRELLARLKAEGLTEEEQKEREVLRQEYLDAIMGNLRRELDNTYIVDEHGNKRKLQGKGFKS